MIAVIFSALVLAHLGGFQTSSAQSHTLAGNAKSYNIEVNNSPLVMSGNDNNLRIGTNRGNILVTGNGNTLQIGNNGGSIKYTGNDGRMRIGSQSAQQSVEYIGNTGVVVVFATNELDFGSSFSVPQYKIVGNENCMRVPHNRNYCEIIGNNIKLLIQNNSGHVKYTGNEGRVLFGRESSEQNVHFIGTNGRQNTVGNVGSC